MILLYSKINVYKFFLIDAAKKNLVLKYLAIKKLHLEQVLKNKQAAGACLLMRITLIVI